MNTSKIAEELLAGDVVRRRAAAEHCAQHGVESAAVVALVRASGDPDESVREWSVSALEEMGSPDVGLVMQLLSLLNNPDENVGYWTATLLGRLGESAAPASAKLGEVVAGDLPIGVRQRAAWALQQIGPAAKDVLSQLLRAAESDDPRLARLAISAIRAVNGP
jgi:HEAT repeat protein